MNNSPHDPESSEPAPEPVPEQKNHQNDEEHGKSANLAEKLRPLIPAPHTQPTTLHSLNGLATVLIILGMTLLNNSMISWQISQQGLQGTEARQTLMNLALYIIVAAFLMLLGIQLLFKRRWACHFLRSLKQMSQLAILPIFLSTILILNNRSLMDDLSSFYQEFIQQLMQQMEPQTNQAISDPITKERIHRILQISFWLLSFLSMGICGLVLRLSKRSLSPEVQKLLQERSPEAGPWSQFILKIPSPFLFLLLLSAYGTTQNLLTLILSFTETQTFLISLLSLTCFALTLLRLTHKSIAEPNLNQNSNLKSALKYCATAYGLQLLSAILQLNTTPTIPTQGIQELKNQATIETLEKVNQQVTALYYIIMLLYFGWLYRKYFRHDEAQDPQNPQP